MGLTARDIMVEEVVCVQETMELDALMKLFVDRRLRGVPVLDETGHLVGVVSTTDVVFRSTAIGDGAVPDTDFHHDHHDEGGGRSRSRPSPAWRYRGGSGRAVGPAPSAAPPVHSSPANNSGQ